MLHFLRIKLHFCAVHPQTPEGIRQSFKAFDGSVVGYFLSAAGLIYPTFTYSCRSQGCCALRAPGAGGRPSSQRTDLRKPYTMPPSWHQNGPAQRSPASAQQQGTQAGDAAGDASRGRSRVRKQGTQAGDAQQGTQAGDASRGRKQGTQQEMQAGAAQPGTPSRGRPSGDAAAGTHRDAAAGTHKGTHSRAGDAQQGTQPGTGDAASARHLQRDGPCWKLALRGLWVLGVLGLIEAGTLPTSLSASRAGHPSGSPPASVGAAHPRGSELDVQGQRFGQSIKVAPRGCDAVGTDGEDL